MKYIPTTEMHMDYFNQPPDHGTSGYLPYQVFCIHDKCTSAIFF